MERPVAAPSPLRLRPALIIAAALMALWLVAYWNLRQLSWDFVQVSRSGPRALALYLTGHLTEAARAYRTGQHGRIPAPYANDPSGYWAMRAGDREEAERRANTTLALVPSAIEPLVTLGELALERGRAPDAVQSFAAVLRRRPGHVDALLLSAVALARTGESGQAIQALNRALRTNEVGVRETILLRVMELAGELRERGAAQQPLCLLAHLHRYLRIFDERQGAVAMDYARRAIAAGDRPADAYLSLGIVLDKRGEYEAARAAMRQAIEVDPRHAEALRWLGAQAGRVGDLLLEYRMITAAFEAAPTDPFYLRDLEHVVVTRLGDPRRMVAFMERAIAADPTNVEAHIRLVNAASQAGDDARARTSARRVAELTGFRGPAR